MSVTSGMDVFRGPCPKCSNANLIMCEKRLINDKLVHHIFDCANINCLPVRVEFDRYTPPEVYRRDLWWKYVATAREWLTL
jgi:hypothetical protein